MRPVLTAEQSRSQDSEATIPASELLERAGLAVALAATRLGAGYGHRVAVLVGPGNNGGDGYVAARFLVRRGVAVDLYPLASPKTTLVQQARDAAISSGAALRDWNDIRRPNLVVDAMFGGGFRGELPDLSTWAGAQATLAVDIPSGVSATTGQAVDGVLSASATITFQSPKVGHLIGSGADLTGQLHVADIGLGEIEPELWLCEEIDAPLPTRGRSVHKWSAGSVLVLGGSDGLDGAATLTAKSALHAGAGAVMIGCPPSVEDKVRAPEIMSRAIGSGRVLSAGDVVEALELAARFDVVVIGPGLGPDAGGFVRGVLAAHEGNVLVDADALNGLESPAELKRRGATVITPHAGEFARLVGAPATYGAASEVADDTETIVLLKGGPTFVMGEGERWVVTSGGPELATIGTGDVLAGIVAAFWAGGLEPVTATRSGAYWHGRTAADLQETRTVTADLMIEHLGVVTRRSHPSSQ